MLAPFLALWLATSAAAADIEISVKGVDGELLKNVLARLELNLLRDNPRLSHHDVKRLHDKADKDIRAALAPFGYYSPEIVPDLQEREGGYLARYVIQPGQPVRIASLDIEVVGPGRLELEKLKPQFPLAVGEVLNQEKYELGKRNIILAAMRRGYMRASFVTRDLKVHRKERRADIHLVLDTGPQFVFGKTTFSGSEVDEDLLARYLPYGEGEPYRPGRLIELQKFLYRTDFFGRVAVEGQLDDVVDQEVPGDVRLAPPEHLNRYSLGLGYATDTGARVRFEWWNRLLNPLGHQVEVTTQLSQFDTNLRVDYTIPWHEPNRDSFGLGIGYHEQSWDDTDTNLFTAGFQYDRKGKRLRHGASFEFRNETYDVGVTSGSSVLFVPTYTGTVIWADDLTNTRYGLDLSVSLSGASEMLGSDESYLKALANGKAILSLMPGLRLIGRGSIGSIYVDSIDSMPPSLRFYAGGDQSVRGYGYRELGTEDASGTVVGGRYLLVGSGEIEKNITDTWSCAAFWDVGNAMDDYSLSLKQGVGVGVRYRLPFGQVRLDVASAISEDGEPLRLHLTVGADL